VSGAPELVFVGGTGRSGTTVTAELLGRHSHFADVPIECRFHCNPNGLSDVVSGRATPEQFIRKLRTYWWHRVRTGSRVIVPAGVAGRARLGAHRVGQRLGLGPDDSRVRGLHQIIDRDRFDAAVTIFERTHGDDLLEASRRLFYDLLEPVRERSGKPALVEMSTFTIAAAPELARIFPEARFVHSVRDGRDSGASKTILREKEHHPTDAISGIDFWADRLRRADLGVKGLPEADGERLHLVSLDELVSSNRDGAYGGLLEFLGIGDEPAMREFFDTSMTAEAANQGRWRDGLDADEQREVTAHYETTLARLELEDYHCAPLLRRTFELTLAPSA
jgi:sulfotransferase family protein